MQVCKPAVVPTYQSTGRTFSTFPAMTRFTTSCTLATMPIVLLIACGGALRTFATYPIVTFITDFAALGALAATPLMSLVTGCAAPRTRASVPLMDSFAAVCPAAQATIFANFMLARLATAHTCATLPCMFARHPTLRACSANIPFVGKCQRLATPGAFLAIR